MQCESTRGTAGAMGGRSSDEPMPGAIQDAVAAAIEDGATMDEIVARVRPRDPAALDGESSPLIPRARRCARARPAEGCWAERMDGLICLQRETVRFVEEWERTRDPRAEGRSALIAIETLRTLALRTMAELGAREEQAAADAAPAHAGPAARAASMTHAERVETVRRALEGHVFPGCTDPPQPAFGWAAASPADSHVTPPDPAPESPAADGAQDADARGVRVARPRAQADDTWDGHRARDAELRRREAEGRIWPTDPPFCPSEWSGPG